MYWTFRIYTFSLLFQSKVFLKNVSYLGTFFSQNYLYIQPRQLPNAHFIVSYLFMYKVTSLPATSLQTCISVFFKLSVISPNVGRKLPQVHSLMDVCHCNIFRLKFKKNK